MGGEGKGVIHSDQTEVSQPVMEPNFPTLPGPGLRRSLLATTYELLQIRKEDAVFPRSEGHLMLGFVGSGKVL